MLSVPDAEVCEPAFVALSIADEPKRPVVTSLIPETVAATAGIVTIEIGADLVVKVEVVREIWTAEISGISA